MTGDPANRILLYMTRDGVTVARRSGVGSRREIWQAVTSDGRWIVDRTEEPGTPWLVFYSPNPASTESDLLAGEYGTLKAARRSIETGEAETAILAQAVCLVLTGRRHSERPQP